MCFLDAEEAAAAMRGAQLELSLLSQPHGEWRLMEVDIASSVLVTGEVGGAVTAAGATDRDAISLLVASECPQGFAVNGHPVRENTPVLFAGTTEILMATTGTFRWTELLIGREDLERAFDSIAPEAMRGLRGISIFNAGAVEGESLLRSYLTATRLAQTQPHLLAEEAARRNMQKALLEAMLRVMAHPPSASHLRSRALGLRVKEYLEAHRDGPVYQMDLCHALRIGQRSLHRLFMEVFGESPGRVLRLWRLNQVRRALKGNGEIPRSVTEIAIRYGFFDLGRFASDYRVLFGELPSGTLAATRLRGNMKPTA